MTGLSRLRLFITLLIACLGCAAPVNSSVNPPGVVAIEELERRAAADSKSAQMMLAIIYLEGNGVTVDVDKAIYYYRLAAEQDVAFAQHRLARLYLDGDRIAPDPDAALAWMLRAAKLGFVPAQLELSQIYRDGIFTPRDVIAAYKWLAIAASLTSADLESQKQELEQQMTFTERARARFISRSCIYRGYEDC